MIELSLFCFCNRSSMSSIQCHYFSSVAGSMRIQRITPTARHDDKLQVCDCTSHVVQEATSVPGIWIKKSHCLPCYFESLLSPISLTRERERERERVCGILSFKILRVNTSFVLSNRVL